jgi:Ca2+-binding EF-hand superfamily protein
VRGGRCWLGPASAVLLGSPFVKRLPRGENHATQPRTLLASKMPPPQAAAAQEIFSVVDRDHSGFLSYEEFARWWVQRAVSTGGSSADEGLLPAIQAAWEQHDVDGSGDLSLEEFEAVLGSLVTSEWVSAFDAATGKDYYFNRSTKETRWTEPQGEQAVQQFLQQHGIELSSPPSKSPSLRNKPPLRKQPPPLQSLYESLGGATGTGTVDANELTLAQVKSFLTSEGVDVEAGADLFAQYDTDRSGTISLSEFGQLVAAVAPHRTDAGASTRPGGRAQNLRERFNSRRAKRSQNGTRFPQSLQEFRALSPHKQTMACCGLLGIILVALLFLGSFLDVQLADECPPEPAPIAHCMDTLAETVSTDVRPAVDIVVVMDTAGEHLEQLATAASNTKLDQRLQAAGAQTNHTVVISLIWDAKQDLDLHCKTPQGTEISYTRKSDATTGGKLDVDNTVGGGGSVENLYFTKPTNGAYYCFVTTYTGTSGTPFTARLTIQGQSTLTKLTSARLKQSIDAFRFSYPAAPPPPPPPPPPPSSPQTSATATCNKDNPVRNLETFINTINRTVDWQLLVANGEDGCGSGILQPSTDNFPAKFLSAVKSWRGQAEPLTSTAIIPATLAAEQSKPGDCNAGAIRKNALLHVVLISPKTTPWSSYLPRLLAVKGGRRDLVKITAIRNFKDTKPPQRAGTRGESSKWLDCSCDDTTQGGAWNCGPHGYTVELHPFTAASCGRNAAPKNASECLEAARLVTPAGSRLHAGAVGSVTASGITTSGTPGMPRGCSFQRPTSGGNNWVLRFNTATSASTNNGQFRLVCYGSSNAAPSKSCSEPGYGYKQAAIGKVGATQMTTPGMDVDICTADWSRACFVRGQSKVDIDCSTSPKCAPASVNQATYKYPTCYRDLIEEIGRPFKVFGTYPVKTLRHPQAHSIKVTFDGARVPGPVQHWNGSANLACGDGSGTLDRGVGGRACAYSLAMSNLEICDKAKELDLDMSM